MDNDVKRKLELTDEERDGLEQIAAGKKPHSQRAQALLSLSEGADLSGAGISADLTANQVRYWLGRFGTRRLSIFPKELFDAPQAEDEVLVEPPLLEAPEEAPMLEAPDLAGELPETIPDDAIAASAAAASVKGAKSKKDKKGKKDKKSKKDKKDKKAKKSKKSKKDKKDKKSKKSKKDKKDKKGKKGKKDKKDKKEKSKKSKKDKKSKKKK